MKIFCYAMAALFAIAGAVSGALVFCIDTLAWLKTGHWAPYTFEDCLVWVRIHRPLTPEWRGVQKIIDYLFDAPLSLSLFGYCIAIAWLFFRNGEKIEREEQRKRRMSV